MCVLVLKIYSRERGWTKVTKSGHLPRASSYVCVSKPALRISVTLYHNILKHQFLFILTLYFYIFVSHHCYEPRINSPFFTGHDDVIKWKRFPRYWPFVRWITKASDSELWCFLLSAPKQTAEQTIDPPVIWDAIVLIMTSLKCSWKLDGEASCSCVFNFMSVYCNDIWDPFYWYELTLITACISNHILSKLLDEITWPFRNFTGCAVAVWEMISSYFIPHFIMIMKSMATEIYDDIYSH